MEIRSGYGVFVYLSSLCINDNISRKQ